MRGNTAIKARQSKQSTFLKCPAQKGMPVPVQCASVVPPEVTHLIGSRTIPKPTIFLSTAIKIIRCFETIAQSISVPGLRCPFRILIGVLTIVKDIKDNCEDARRLLVLCEKHLGIALDFTNNTPLSTFSVILERFIQILLEINDNTDQIKNRSRCAALRYVLSDKERLRAYTQKLNDELPLFLHSFSSEVEERRVAQGVELSREITSILNRIDTKIDTIVEKLDRISSRLDDVERRICPEPDIERTDTKRLPVLAEIITLVANNTDTTKSKEMSCPLNFHPLSSERYSVYLT